MSQLLINLSTQRKFSTDSSASSSKTTNGRKVYVVHIYCDYRKGTGCSQLLRSYTNLEAAIAYAESLSTKHKPEDPEEFFELIEDENVQEENEEQGIVKFEGYEGLWKRKPSEIQYSSIVGEIFDEKLLFVNAPEVAVKRKGTFINRVAVDEVLLYDV